MTPRQHKKITKIASKFREVTGYDDGVVIIDRDETLCGWMDKLRNPEQWMPGCIAIDAIGQCYKSCGGDDYNGAKSWEQIEA